MTVKELSELYGVPEKIVSKFSSEFLLNTPGTNEFQSGLKNWEEQVREIYAWTVGEQDKTPTITVTAFNPPGAYVTTQQEFRDWMLSRTSDADKAYYAVKFSGSIDRRLGFFRVEYKPYVAAVVSVNSAAYRFWKIYVTAGIDRYDFYGIAANIALYENRLNQNYDIGRLRTALYYINAAKKYAQELSVTQQLAKQRAAADLENYRRTLADNMRRETNDLEQKKLSMRVALSGQKSAALGNMQNALISLQALKF